MRTTFNISSPRTRYSGLNRRTLRLALVLVILALGLIVLDDVAIVRTFKGHARALLQPVERAFTQTRLSVRRSTEAALGVAELHRQVEALEHELGELRQENLRLQSLQTENNQLKVELGIRQTYEWITTYATVVQTNAENGRRIIRIDRGRVDGIQLGMPVVAKEGGSPAALVGIVDVLYAQTADILLITDYGAAISAHTTHPAQTKGMVTGQWQVGSRIRLVDVDPAAPLAAGDYVVTSGLSKGLASDTPMAQVPANIPIGTVTNVERTNHTQTAEVQPFVDPDRVRNVWVITGQN
jgi:rod shape-determining protein MreC